MSFIHFGCFDTGPKYRNNPKKIFFGLPHTPRNNRNILSFGLFWFEPKRKKNCFEDTLIESVFWRFFGLF